MPHFSQVAAAQTALNINDVEVCLLQMISEIKQIMVLVKLPDNDICIGLLNPTKAQGQLNELKLCLPPEQTYGHSTGTAEKHKPMNIMFHFRHFLSCAVLYLHYSMSFLESNFGKIRLSFTISEIESL